jgi:hypothetical protein
MDRGNISSKGASPQGEGINISSFISIKGGGEAVKTRLKIESFTLFPSMPKAENVGPNIMGLALMTKRTNMFNVGHVFGIGIDTKIIKYISISLV